MPTFRRSPFTILLVIGVLVLLIGYAIGSRIGYDVLTLTSFSNLHNQPRGEFTDITFPARGQRWLVHGFYLSGAAGHPALVNVHGYRSTRHAQYELDRADDMRAMGYSVLSIDLKDNGGDTVDNNRISMGYNERYDVLGAYDYLLSKGFTPDRIGLVGESMGATSVLLAAALEPNIRAIWADSPYADTYAVVSEDAPTHGFSPIFVTGGIAWGFLLTGDRIWEAAPIQYGAILAANKQAVYLIHDEKDTIVYFHHGVELHNTYQKAGVEVTFWDVPDLDHVQALTYHHAEYLRRLDQFFGRHLAAVF